MLEVIGITAIPDLRSHWDQVEKLGDLRESTFFAIKRILHLLFPLREYFRNCFGQASVKLRSSFGYPESGNVSKKVAKLRLLGMSAAGKAAKHLRTIFRDLIRPVFKRGLKTVNIIATPQ